MESPAVQTWHYGIVATWWAEFLTDGPEIDFFRPFVTAGQPALDVGCGTGRLLAPYALAGLDVDGVDVSPDMLERCSRAAQQASRAPTLTAQAIHQLDLPRRYRTIYVCGGFGLGTTREQDLEGLRRMHAHLLPGGRLVMDHQVPYADAAEWSAWTRGHAGRTPVPALPPEPPGDRRRASDGCDYAVLNRFVSIDPLSQREVREIYGWRWRDGALLDTEHHRLTANNYFHNELVMLLEAAGFNEIEVVGGYHGRPATAEDEFLVFIARS